MGLGRPTERSGVTAPRFGIPQAQRPPCGRAARFRFVSRRLISPDSVNTNTSSPVIVLMSWCMLTHPRPVDSCTNASIRGREVSSMYVRTFLSMSRPFSGGCTAARLVSAGVRIPCMRTSSRSPIRCVRISLGPRPMNSCMKCATDSQIDASTSPRVFMQPVSFQDGAPSRSSGSRSTNEGLPTHQRRPRAPRV